MASPEVIALLDEHAHRMPMRADQIRAIAATLTHMRTTMGEEAAIASPQYIALLRLLRAHARPVPNPHVSFAQVQAVRLQMLATRLRAEEKPFPPQLAAAIRQGLVAGFDPATGNPLPPGGSPQFQNQPQSYTAVPGQDSSQPDPSQPDSSQPDPVPWSERRLPVRRVDMSIVKPALVEPALLFDERRRALAYRMTKTSADITEILSNHETAHFLGPRAAALLEGRRRHVSLLQLQREMRQNLLHENALAESEGRRGSKQRARVLKQLQKEHEKLDRVRIRREEAEEREQRKRQQAWMNALTDHTDRFRRYHRDVVRRGVRAVLKSMGKYHDELSRNATRAEREAERARIQKLKDDDEEGYLELVRETKNTRLLELLNQTDTYLRELGAIVKEERAKSGEVDYDQGGGGASGLHEKHRYYDIAHAIKEEITDQSSLMVGGTLKEYQLQGIQWMVSLYNNRLNGILADEMGLGKTIQTLGLITYLMEMKENSGPFLIIVPLSTMSNWELEFARWAPAVTVIVFKGDSKTRRQIYENVIEKNKFNVCLATYEYVVRGKNWLKRVHWQHIIIDEGHRIKNHESKLSLVLHKDYTSRSRLLLTGTPLQNSLTELWALLNFLLPKVFKSAESFESWFAAPFAQMGVGNVSASEETAQLTEEENLLIIRRLHQVLRPFLLRRLKADVLRMGEQLPDKQEHIVICDMSAWQRAMYVKIVKSERILFVDRHGRKRYDKLSNPAMQLKKCVNHPYLFYQDHSSMVVDSPDLWRCAGKFDMLDACLGKFLKSGHRILVFNQMTKVVDLQARLLNYRKVPFYRLDGTTPPDARKGMVSDFNDPSSDVNVFLLTTRAGGLGVNLQTADTVIIFDSDWNPSMDQQAQDRAHRIGQQREVLILRMITAKSVEEDVIERASFKRGLEEKIIRAGMFDESSKDSERQAMLRELLRVEEAASDGEDGEGDADGMPTDEEINRLLSRSEEEFEMFQAIDKDRALERKNKPKLYTEAEIPDFAVKVPKDLLAKSKSSRKDEDLEDLTEDVAPRKRAASQNVSYGLDSLSDRQYIKLMEKAGEGEFASLSEGIKDAVEGRKRRGRPPKPVPVEIEEEEGDGELDVAVEEGEVTLDAARELKVVDGTEAEATDEGRDGVCEAGISVGRRDQERLARVDAPGRSSSDEAERAPRRRRVARLAAETDSSDGDSGGREGDEDADSDDDIDDDGDVVDDGHMSDAEDVGDDEGLFVTDAMKNDQGCSGGSRSPIARDNSVYEKARLGASDGGRAIDRVAHANFRSKRGRGSPGLDVPTSIDGEQMKSPKIPRVAAKEVSDESDMEEGELPEECSPAGVGDNMDNMDISNGDVDLNDGLADIVDSSNEAIEAKELSTILQSAVDGEDGEILETDDESA